jgi:hypothetical protein
MVSARARSIKQFVDKTNLQNLQNLSPQEDLMEIGSLKGDPVKLFWKEASCWRKLSLLRVLNALKTDLASRYLREIMQLQNEDGGFCKSEGEGSYVSVTAEAIIYLIGSGEESCSPIIQQAVDFLWGIQKENGSWHENPKLPKDKIPFWSSSEKGVPILTADSIEALVEAGFKDDDRTLRAVNWLLSMQSPSGLWLSIEGADPKDTEPDSTQRAISALLKFGMQVNSPVIRRACSALEDFIMTEAEEWAKVYPPVWPWVAALDGLVASGYGLENEAVQVALNKILEHQQDDGSWPNRYELRVVPILVALELIPKERIWKSIEISNEGEL